MSFITEDQRISRASLQERSGRAGRRNWTRFRLEGASAHVDDDLKLLPASATEFYSQKDQLIPWGWNETLRTLLEGTRSETSETPLTLLRHHEDTLIRSIMSMLSSPLLNHVRLTIPAGLAGNSYNTYRMRFDHGRDGGHQNWGSRELIEGRALATEQQDGYVAFARCGKVVFPEPNDRNVNMMPFILGQPESLPQDLRCYYDLIRSCPYVKEEEGKVAYLTVQESDVHAGQSQRRRGLHIESPGFFNDDSNASAFTPGVEHPWGMGVFFGPDHYEGGIYFASNQSGTSRVWNALVDSSVPGIVNNGGGCEHLRPWIGKATELEAGELIWMTDRTPHEAIVQESPGHRQFFRLVMPYVNHWYSDHSTPNPKVPLPDTVKIVEGDKFKKYAIASTKPNLFLGE
mmetsp:Transcript_18520/g.34481  ORF Transcript_18520/g.34481 Transcript_18520/m.34481 type:complete len:402 (+) Transcript_18520:146-1351(+)